MNDGSNMFIVYIVSRYVGWIARGRLWRTAGK
jgi:hypothetical protein